jgi:hypothetical protein
MRGASGSQGRQGERGLLPLVERACRGSPSFHCCLRACEMCDCEGER